MGTPDAECGMYSRACCWVTADRATRLVLKNQRASDWRRIARLGDTRGKALDKLGASEALLRWIAGPVRRDPVATERRYLAAVALLQERGRLTRRDEEALANRRDPETGAPLFPKLVPRAPRHALEAAVTKALQFRAA